MACKLILKLFLPPIGGDYGCLEPLGRTSHPCRMRRSTSPSRPPYSGPRGNASDCPVPSCSWAAACLGFLALPRPLLTLKCLEIM